jgi:hypothetical protein
MIPSIHLSVTIHSGLRTAHHRAQYTTTQFPASIYLLPSTVVSALIQSTIYQQMIPSIHLSVTIHSGLRTAHTEYYIPIDNSPHPSICYHPQWSPQCLYRVHYTTRRFPRIHLSGTIHSGLRSAHTEYNIPLDDFSHPSICYHPQWSPHCSYRVQYSTIWFPIYLVPSTVVSAVLIQSTVIH